MNFNGFSKTLQSRNTSMSYHKANNLTNHLFADRTRCPHLQNVKNFEFERKQNAFNKV